MPPTRRVTTVQPKPELSNGHKEGDVTELSPGVFEVPDEEEGSRIEERPPTIATPTVSQRMKAATERVRSLPTSIRQTKSSIRKPRVSVEGLITAAWGFGARLIQPMAWPVANVLRLQSPIAGAILEDSVKNTVADTVLQPIARLVQGSEIGFALLGPPVLVGIACAKPESQPFVEPLLREALKSWLTVAGPKMIELAEKERKFQEEYGDTIDGMIKAIFTPPEGMAVPTGDSASTS